MRNLMKRASVLVTAAVMLIGSFPQVGGAEEALTPDAYGLYPTAAYTTVSSELDDSRKWKYRELVPDVGCETIAGFWDKNDTPTSPNTNVALSTDAYRGSYSVSRTMSGYKKLGAKVENLDVYTEKNPAEYLLSMYAKADLAEGLTSVNLTPAYLVNGYKELSFQYPGTNMPITINNEWGRYTRKMQIYERDVKSIDKSKDMYMYFYANAKDSLSNTIYLDEWSLRMAIPDNLSSSYVKSISPSPAKPAIKNGEDLTFKFSLDIDPRTVRKENITVNGTANSSLVKAVNVTTDEATRETTLTISFNTLTVGTTYTIALPEIKDAWDRKVVGTTTASVTCVPADAQYTIYDELDSTGKWAYRNIVPDPECEDASVFYDGDYNLNIDSKMTKVETDNDAHSGNASIARTCKIWGKIGFAVTGYDTEATYYTSIWMKSDNEDAGVSVSFANNLGVDSEGKRKEEAYRTSFSSNATDVTSDWTYYSSTLKLSSSAGSNPEDGYMWVMNNERKAGVSETVGTSTYVVNRVYVDDWNMRKIPSWRVNVQGVEVEGNTAVFKFDKDIDPWTVTADKILVNGEANSASITSAVVATDEITRETTLTVTMNSEIDDECVIALPDTARDAWGREILNVQSTGFVIGKAHIIDATGEIVSAEDMTAGTRSYKVTGIQNNSANPVRVASIIALYNANGVCLDVRIDSQTFAKGTIGGELCASLTIPKNAEAEDMYIKTFLWDMNTLYPYNKPLKVLVIGNSYTYHTPKLSYGWIGDWGMAASAPEKDYVHQLQAKLQDVNSGVQMKWFTISNLEKYYLTDDVEVNAPKYYQEAIDFDADVIIATFGANIGDGTWEGDDEYESVSQPFTKDHYKYIIDKFNPDNDAVVIAGNTMSEKTDLSISKKEAISAAAQENGYIFVDVADIITNYPAKAEYVAEGGAEKYKNALDPTVTESGVIYEAVLNHPGDEGMKLIAERLFNEGLIPALKRIGIK